MFLTRKTPGEKDTPSHKCLAHRLFSFRSVRATHEGICSYSNGLMRWHPVQYPEDGCLCPLPTSPLLPMRLPSFKSCFKRPLHRPSSDLNTWVSVSSCRTQPAQLLVSHSPLSMCFRLDRDPLRQWFSAESHRKCQVEPRTRASWEGLSRAGHFCKAPRTKTALANREISL